MFALGRTGGRVAHEILLISSAEFEAMAYIGRSATTRYQHECQTRFKALLAIWSFRRSGKKRPDRDRIILVFSTAVTLGLFAPYLYGKLTGRL